MVKRKATQDRRKRKTRPRNVTRRIKEAREKDAPLVKLLKKEVSDDAGAQA